MPHFHTQKQVCHSAEQMFALVADIELYPEFVPMCTALTIRSRQQRGAESLLLADMSVGYKMMRESFTTQVYLQPDEQRIDVHYIDGPFKHLENRWQFLPLNGQKAEQAERQSDKPGGEPLGELKNPHNTAGEETSGLKIPPITAGGEAPLSRQSPVPLPLSAEQTELTVLSDSNEACLVDFYIDYAFKNPILAALMGTMFDIAFRKFTQAFEMRADKIYGVKL